MLRIFIINLFQVLSLFSKFIDIELIKQVSNTYYTFGRPYDISPYLDFSWDCK